MRSKLAAILSLCLVTAAQADIDVTLDTHVLPGMDRFAAATAALADAPCTPEALRPAFADAALAWAAVSHLTFGPVETDGRARAILFWPEERNATARGLRLMSQQGPEAWTAEAIARASVAARGLAGLERLIWEDAGAPCALTKGLAVDLAATAGAIRDDWADGYADLMRDPGSDGNTRFLTGDEVQATLFTALLTGLDLTADQRLGRPMGTFDAPAPTRAQLYRSEMSVPIVIAALMSMRDLADTLANAPRTQAALTRAIDRAGALQDPGLQGVADPAGRLRVEALQSAVRDARAVADEEIGAILNVAAGFNSADGD